MNLGTRQAAVPGVIFAVERGNPSPEELAAVVMALMARITAAQDAGPRGGQDRTSRTRSGWAHRPARDDPRSWQAARLPCQP